MSEILTWTAVVIIVGGSVLVTVLYLGEVRRSRAGGKDDRNIS